MKAYLLVGFVCLILFENVNLTLVTKPSLSSSVVVPYTTNTVYLDKPYCYFDNVNSPKCVVPNTCNIWLAAALSSATSTLDTDKNTAGFTNNPYQNAFNAGNKNYFLTMVGPASQYICSASTTPTPYFLVGAEGACLPTNCNGVLPSGATMSFKYLLLDQNKNFVEDTNWSDNITLLTVKSPDSIGSAYAGRSGAMVVITSILCVAAALLLLLLLIALILACCYTKRRTNSFTTTTRPPQVQQTGSLRIPSYDVHHLKQPSPYDNLGYEQDLKKRYTTNATLPQKTITVHSTVPDNITLQKM